MTTGIFTPQAAPHAIHRAPRAAERQEGDSPFTIGNVLATACKSVGLSLAGLVLLAFLFVSASAPPVGLLALMLVLPAGVPFLVFGLIFFATQEVEAERKNRSTSRGME